MFVISCQQADMPNHCCNCNALRAAIAGLSYSLQFLLIPHGSYGVLHATSFISSFVPLHYTSFAAKPFASRLAISFFRYSFSLLIVTSVFKCVPYFLFFFKVSISLSAYLMKDVDSLPLIASLSFCYLYRLNWFQWQELCFVPQITCEQCRHST